MKQLNKNSYYVYIIHMIVLGLIAMILVPISIPVYFKFLILTLLTFTLSNLIVYAYRIFAPKQVSTRTATSVLVVACILTAVIYVEQAKAVHTNTSSTTIQTSLSTHDTGIHEAIIRGNIEVIKQHIASGSDLNEKEATGGSSPLITAAVFGQTEAALLLIEAGADVNLVNNDGSTPLHSAAFFCHTEIVEALLLNGADTNIKNNAGSTALAAVTGSFDSVVGIYQYFGNTLEPLGLKLDLEKIKETRPRVAEIIKNYSQD